eukprot:COSAG05_NODE_3230_length_2221_cov_2428.137931_2_plen_89_part_00
MAKRGVRRTAPEWAISSTIITSWQAKIVEEIAAIWELDIKLPEVLWTRLSTPMGSCQLHTRKRFQDVINDGLVNASDVNVDGRSLVSN